MNTLFDSAGLAIVAYAEVLGNGTTPAVNSGITVTKATDVVGHYVITLPSGKAQGSSVSGQYPRDLILTQALVTQSPLPVLSAAPDPNTTINADGSGSFNVYTTQGSTLADGAFSLLILRTLLPTPSAGGPT